jgi:uroporphyrinogen decarboxylase
LDIYQTVQPEIYDLISIKKQFGDNLTFWGGISTQRLLPFATPEIVAKTTKETIELMSKGGGYIISPTHAVSADTPIENIIAMMNEFGHGKIL